MTCRGIEGKDSCGKCGIRKSLCSFRLTALYDIIYPMALCRVLAIIMRLTETPRPTVPQA